MDEAKFKPGDRVAISEKGLRAGLRRSRADVLGTVTVPSEKSPGCFNVRWDSTKSAEAYHPSFLKLAEDPGSDPQGETR